MHSDDPELMQRFRLAAEELNLAGHVVKGVRLYSACDVEGHKGEDDRYYLVDFAR